MIDQQTFIDLNIIPDGTSGLSLKTKLDHCQTKGGKEYLDGLLQLQQTSYRQIMERQHSVRFITTQLGRWKMPVQEDDVFYLTQYMRSTYLPLTGKNRVKKVLLSLKRFVFNKEQYYFTLSGIKVTLRVLQEIVLLCRSVFDPAMPGSLKEKLIEVQETVAALAIGEQTFNIFLHEEPGPELVFRLDSELRVKHSGKITAMLGVYYELEAYYSLAAAHVQMKLTFPELQEHGTDIYLQALSHPLVPHCNPNTITTDGRNMVIITGPNMSGKSTFMKSVGVAFVMAYLGIGVAAEAAVMPVMDIITTCIDIKDDIEKGYSYFFSEVKRIRSIAEKVGTGKRVIVIGDELFKGTNVQDAVDCTTTVLQGFLKHSRNFYFIATHFTSIAEQLQSEPQCFPVCFDGKVAGETISFDYRLKPGISTLRIGSLILKQQQVTELLDPTVAPVPSGL